MHRDCSYATTAHSLLPPLPFTVHIHSFLVAGCGVALFAWALTDEAEFEDRVDMNVSKGVVIAVLVIHSVIFLWTFLCMMSVCCKSHAGVRSNMVLFIIVALAHIALAIVAFVDSNWVAGGVGAGAAVIALFGAYLCRRCARAIDAEDTAAATSKLIGARQGMAPPV
jgi:cytochrome bd-type quinol oxidase subunit 2